MSTSTLSCGHWALTTTGLCETCGADVTVEDGTSVTVHMGSMIRDQAHLTGERTVRGAAPTVREALAYALGVPVTAVQIVDAQPSENSWESATGVVFTLGGKVQIGASVSSRSTLVRTPERVDYERVA